MRRVSVIVGILLLLTGLGLFLAPDVYNLYFTQRTRQTISEFRAERGFSGDESNSPEAESKAETDGNLALLEQYREYNAQIYADKQSGLTDAWSYEQSPFAGGESLFGTIEIPAMDVVLPLYLGATTEHLADGAAVLGQTSVPIGGENTNAVIAGHRGYRGAPYFREIEKLKPGDTVTVENSWETLTYTVSEIEVIRPDDLNAILIQEGRDMITLVTCHPYRSGGKFRYVVYCDRTGTKPAEPSTQTPGQVPADASGEEIPLESSEEDIHSEKMLRYGGAAILFLLLLWLIGAGNTKE